MFYDPYYMEALATMTFNVNINPLRRLTSSTPAMSVISVSDAIGCELRLISLFLSIRSRGTYSRMRARLTDESSRNTSGLPVPKLTLRLASTVRSALVL